MVKEVLTSGPEEESSGFEIMVWRDLALVWLVIGPVTSRQKILLSLRLSFLRESTSIVGTVGGARLQIPGHFYSTCDCYLLIYLKIGTIHGTHMEYMVYI